MQTVWLWVLIGGLAAGSIQAQDATPTTAPGDTLLPTPVTYLYGNSAVLRAKGAAQVRRRLARIGPHRTVRREVYPVWVVPSTAGLTAQDLLPAEVNRDETALVQEVEQALLTTGRFRTIDVVFAPGQRSPRPVSQRVLDAVGAVLVRTPALHVEIRGHTDATGSSASNQRLSEARAQAVRRYLIDRFDLAPDRLAARGYGATRPVASNAHATGRALNRRVEFVVVR